MIDKNIVGQGGSGTVYKIQLSNGEVVAVKKLLSRSTKDFSSEDRLDLDKELKTEVETLGSIRHKNIVKLYSYFSRLDCSLLVYEYMPNGNLWDALHNGKILLDWPTRHQIALGVAQGLAYLHHDLKLPIIHRDIKSTNILLDINYKPKVADFGIAKVLQARGGKDSTTTVIAGTYGYMAPGSFLVQLCSDLITCLFTYTIFVYAKMDTSCYLLIAFMVKLFHDPLSTYHVLNWYVIHCCAF